MKIEIYQTNKGAQPFQKWLDKLLKNNGQVANKILDKIRRLSRGESANTKALQGHRPLMEIKVNAYRVYCVMEGQKLIILLCGGDKGSQTKDIKQAMRYWDDYQSRR